MLKKVMGAAAAAALALTGAVVTSPLAHADGTTLQPVGQASQAQAGAQSVRMDTKDLSPMSKILCSNTRDCGVGTPIRLGTDPESSWQEGKPMSINVLGQKDRQVQVRAFAIRWVSETEYTAVPISNAVAATPTGSSAASYGQTRVEVTIGKIPAPYDGSLVVVQTADWTPRYGALSSSRAATKIDEVQVRSARGRDTGFAEQNFTDYFHRKVDTAITGDKYSVQLLRGGKWVTIDTKGPGTVGRMGTAVVQAAPPKDLPTGKYRTRLVNVTRNVTDISPDEPFTYFTWTYNATPPKPGDKDFNVYTTPGVWDYNGRKWKTNCEPYSATERCRTEIWATQILYSGGKFSRVDGWAFNNLTYKASARSLWKGNPIGGNGTVGYKGSWTAADGRKWRVECDSAATGGGGCRSYAVASVAEAAPGGGYRVVSKELFNNIVLFS
ncbi:hypothetical protein [Tessaracoccus massiliensis]|uniref:hypothetical protein n=1 Tax=Tessaracoccus massiliensis TaxID=1522311 RepID=UPI00058C957F|nr:hypothetical protein [Tessaracoccus massiliensis]